MISCPGNLFARVISGQCEAGHYRQPCQWSRKTKAGGHEVLSISPLEFLNLYTKFGEAYSATSQLKASASAFGCSKAQRSLRLSDKENPYGLHLDLRFSNRLLNHENTSRQEEGASKRLLLIFCT